MNCIIPGQNIKILSKTINALAKIGDEIYLEADLDKLEFTTLNMSKTVCSQSSFLKSFFSSYDIKMNDSADDKTITCKLFMKSLLPLFKGNLEKKLEFLRIEYETESDFVILKMKYKYDQIMMIHKLRLMDSEKLSIGITPNSGMNNLYGSSTLFNQLLMMFNLSDNEITLEIMNSRLVARNYCIGAAPNPKLMRVEVKLSAGEFIKFDVENDTNINFALKPLRTVISFAESLNLHIGINFDSGGKPLTLLMKHPTFSIHFIVSTLNPNRDLQSSMASTSLPLTQIVDNLNISTVVPYESPIINTDDKFSQSPESPRSKRVKLVFSRCYEPTFVEPDLAAQENLGNSDSE
ncbi:cell cycle checkpoint control protein RAD9A-like [Harmonia axyridis]|uniref:cell cycle checkpoint control protein RAD9A-like n=1 Tax=Harmonia axyridis TaxID=115357 RepID=UPI001E279069|nr:cell cycle checkpoint control protein RAD9A-like [Harmonia axyridis]